MNAKVRDAFARKLRRQRERIFKTVADIESDLQFIAEDREADLEERAQEERAARLLARLDIRGKHAIEEIDAALQRIADGTYGRCVRCGRRIAMTRLRALPATPVCVRCAKAAETATAGPAAEEKELPPAPAEIDSPDLCLLSDREIETALREQVRLDKRIDTHELRIVCRHGIVYLDGALPSEAEHQILLKTLQDVAGFKEIVDRVQVKEILWEREDRSKGETPGAPLPDRRIEPPDTEDIVTSLEEGIEYIPPDEPPPEEE